MPPPLSNARIPTPAEPRPEPTLESILAELEEIGSAIRRRYPKPREDELLDERREHNAPG